MVGVPVGDAVVEVGAAAASGGIGKHVDGLAEPEVFGDPGRDLVAVHRGRCVVQIDDRLQQHLAAVPEQLPQPGQQHRPDILDRAKPRREVSASSDRCTYRSPGAGSGRVERRRPDPQRPTPGRLGPFDRRKTTIRFWAMVGFVVVLVCVEEAEGFGRLAEQQTERLRPADVKGVVVTLAMEDFGQPGHQCVSPQGVAGGYLRPDDPQSVLGGAAQPDEPFPGRMLRRRVRALRVGVVDRSLQPGLQPTPRHCAQRRPARSASCPPGPPPRCVVAGAASPARRRSTGRHFLRSSAAMRPGRQDRSRPPPECRHLLP